jgi:hypothetical protein
MQLKSILLATAALASLSAHASPPVNLVSNGDFESNGGLGQLGGGISFATGWTSGTPSDAAVAFNFIVDATADSVGFPSVNTATVHTNIFMWGPGKGVSNGFTGSSNGGKFLGSDADYANAPVSQVINGLTVGKQYAIGFEWAQGQFTDATGPTTTGWNVSFGSENQSTGAAALPSQGFSGWKNYAGTFTASAASQTLSFLAIGGPAGLPPFALLDGVTLTEVPAVPEPGTLALMLAGFGLVGVMAKRRQRAA